MCSKSCESSDHLYLHCVSVLQLWHRLLSTINFKWISPNGIAKEASLKAFAANLEGTFFGRWLFYPSHGSFG